MNETKVRPWDVEPEAFPEGAPQSAQFAFLLRYAHLAPSSHNTQQLQVGQVFERMFLTVTALGMALQPMNQILQVAETRTAFEELLPAAWGEPQLTFRLGYARPEEHTPRRELSDVLR